MKIAFISDIHANLPALEAVLQGIDSQAPNAIFCLGDLVNQNVWNNEVVELIRKRAIRTVRGNHDNGIALGKKLFPFSAEFETLSPTRSTESDNKETFSFSTHELEPRDALSRLWLGLFCFE